MLFRILLICFCLVSSACATLVEDTLMKADNDQWIYGTGIGPTKEIAHRMAFRELAIKVLDQRISGVQSRFHVRDGDVDTTSHALHYSVSNVELESAQTDKIIHHGGSTNIRLRIPAASLIPMQNRAKKKSASMAIVNELQSKSTQSAAMSMRLAISGLQQSMEDGVLNERFAIEGKKTQTFLTYFRHLLLKKISNTRIATVPSDNAEFPLDLHLVEAPDFSPLTNLPVRIDAIHSSTDVNGKLSLSTAMVAEKSTFDLYVAFDIASLEQAGILTDEDMRLDTIHLPTNIPAMTKVYVHSHTNNGTASAVVKIVEAGGIVTINTPTEILLQPGKQYRFITLDSDTLKENTILMKIPLLSPSFYVSLQLQEKRYGGINLHTDSSAATISLSGPSGTIIRNSIIKNDTLETGVYDITVSRPDKKDYQQIVDQITVEPGKTVIRSYKAPIDRDYYFYGFYTGISVWMLGREASDDYLLPGSITAREFQSQHNLNIDSWSGLILEYKYFTNTANIMLQGQYGLIYAAAKESSGIQRTKLEASGSNAEIGAGFYLPTNKGLFWIASGAAEESLRWDLDKSTIQGLSSEKSRNKYNFVELGWILGSLKLSIKKPLKKSSPYLSISMGFQRLRKGYNHTATRSAEPDG